MTTARLVLPVVFVAVFVPARPAAAASCDYVQTIAHAVATNATIVNVFWSTNWDGVAPADLTMAALDAFTQALVDSTYFDPSNTNYGTGTPTFGGSIQDATFPPMAGSVDVPYMSNEVNAALMNPAFAGMTNILVNLFVPPGTKPLNLVNNNCTGGNFNAFHTKSNLVGMTPFGVIPLDPICGSATFDTVSHKVSHELVEAMTDPGGAGYVHNFDFGNGEVADICQRGTFGTSTIPFLTGSVDPYFSDGDCGCVPSWNDPGDAVRATEALHRFEWRVADADVQRPVWCVARALPASHHREHALPEANRHARQHDAEGGRQCRRWRQRPARRYRELDQQRSPGHSGPIVRRLV